MKLSVPTYLISRVSGFVVVNVWPSSVKQHGLGAHSRCSAVCSLAQVVLHLPHDRLPVGGWVSLRRGDWRAPSLLLLKLNLVYLLSQPNGHNESRWTTRKRHKSLCLMARETPWKESLSFHPPISADDWFVSSGRVSGGKVFLCVGCPLVRIVQFGVVVKLSEFISGRCAFETTYRRTPCGGP